MTLFIVFVGVGGGVGIVVVVVFIKFQGFSSYIKGITDVAQFYCKKTSSLNAFQ